MSTDTMSANALITDITSVQDIWTAIDNINPKLYDKTRNYLDGAVTWLSPYITHGVIDTVDVADRVLTQHDKKHCYKLLFELAWREYFHYVWQDKGRLIFDDLLQAQQSVEKDGVPESICQGSTGITVLDNGLQELFATGRMHNHMRMWIAGITCNLGHTSWKDPARWFHYHLLDGDLASNTLSWQWIAGTFSHKRYIANQANINKYSRTEQHNTWLDLSYDELNEMATPSVLRDSIPRLALTQSVPGTPCPDEALGTIALRSIWNLDVNWRTEVSRHVLFIDKQHVKSWPMSENRWAFIQHWASHFNAEIWLDDVSALDRLDENGTHFIRREYPACSNWPGSIDSRRFLYDYPKHAFNSFSQFWKQVKDQ